MKTVEDYEQIRRAFFVEGLSIREIHRRLQVARKTIRKAIVEPTPKPYQLEEPRPAPVLGPYKERIKALLDESDKLPRKQRYTARTIYRIIREEGYQGSESARDENESRSFCPWSSMPGKMPRQIGVKPLCASPGGKPRCSFSVYV
jgi:transposase